MSEISSERVLLVLAEVVGVTDEVVGDDFVKVVEDCGAVLTGDHDARAMAEKVSDGEEPLHPASPQHSQASVLAFHLIQVALSLAEHHALVNTALSLRYGRLLTAGGTADRIAIRAVCAATNIVTDVLQTDAISATLRAWNAAQLCSAVGHLGVIACEPVVHGVDLVLGAPEAV